MISRRSFSLGLLAIITPCKEIFAKKPEPHWEHMRLFRVVTPFDKKRYRHDFIIPETCIRAGTGSIKYAIDTRKGRKIMVPAGVHEDLQILCNVLNKQLSENDNFRFRVDDEYHGVCPMKLSS